MRISELLQESIVNEVTRPSSLDAATKILYNAGYEQIGEGYYGEVFAKPGDKYALKLFDYRDAAYRRFLNVAITESNSHFPQFRGKLIKVASEYYAIRMEMLSYLKPSGPGWTDRTELCRALSQYIIACWNKDNPDSASEIKNPSSHDIDAIEKHQPGIKQACQSIASILRRVNELDLHSDNVMMRGDTIVIIDPVSA